MKKINLCVLIFLTGLLAVACNNKKKETKSMNNMPGMNMPDAAVKKNNDAEISLDTIDLKSLLRPTTQFVVSSLPVTILQQKTEPIEINALGSVQNDNRQIHSLSSRISGRIEKLYVRYRYQYVNKGQKVLEIYSPELLTAQQNLIFLLQSDPTNHSMINAARKRLLLLGMSVQQMEQISKSGKPFYSVAVFSPYSGYVTEPAFTKNRDNNIAGNNMQQNNGNNIAAQTTVELQVKEGMYVNRSQPVFELINVTTGRISLSIFADQQKLVKKGTPVMIIPETAPDKKFKATIDWVEPFFTPGSKTVSARVYFNNSVLRLPIGSQVQATVFAPAQTAYWLPASAVIATGLNNVVFKKEGNGFSPKSVTTGLHNNNHVQITSGLLPSDSVAVNAQHLIESESIINVKQ